jgi:elongation factor P
MSISPTMLKNGARILIDGEVYVVVEFLKMAMGRGRGRVATKLRHIVSGKVIDRTFRSTDEVEIADAEFREMQFIYKENDDFVFMDNHSYEQQSVADDIVGFSSNFLAEGSSVRATIFKGCVIGIEMPPKVDFEVIDTIDTVKGNTATNVTKDASINTGFVVKVPLFIKKGDKVRIKTENGEYVERVNS